MWNTKKWTGSVLVALVLAAVGCADDRSGDVTGPELHRGGGHDDGRGGGMVYHQVEFLGNPLVSEVTIVKANHDQYNRTQPYNTAEFLPQTAEFVTMFGRPVELAQTLGSVLYPDILVVDSSKDPGSAGWLSWALANGYGGRKLTDDVVDAGLSAVFGSLLDPNNTSPGLASDNVGANDKAFLTTFPYLAAPTP